MTEGQDVLRAALLARTRIELANMDYRRIVKRLSAEGWTQALIAQAMGVSQPTIAQMLRRARDLSDVVEGFAGAGPMEICQRYAVGELSYGEVVGQLARWDYAPVEYPVLGDDLAAEAEGGWGEVEVACDHGLIADELVDDVQAEQERLGRA